MVGPIELSGSSARRQNDVGACFGIGRITYPTLVTLSRLNGGMEEAVRGSTSRPRVGIDDSLDCLHKAFPIRHSGKVG